MKRIAIFLLALPCICQTLPPASVPGALNENVTQANIHRTICVPGWTKTIRPPAEFTTRLKAQQIAEWGLPGRLKDYEEDHRCPLELGGNPTDPANLWPEPWARPYGAHEKDRLENAVRRDVCSGKITLYKGQAIFLGNWWVEYQRRLER